MLKLISNDEIISPILLKLWGELKKIKDPTRKKEQIETFWKARDGPLKEEMKEHEEHYLVTFLFREKRETNELRVFCPAFGSSYLSRRGKMIKFKDPDVDIYYKSVYILKKSLLSYCFLRETIQFPQYNDIPLYRNSKFIPDELNPHTIDYELEEDPGSNFSLSILTMPDFPEQIWMKENKETPRGTMSDVFIDIDDGMRKKIEEKKEKNDKEKINEEIDEDDEIKKTISDEKNPLKYKIKIYLPPNYSGNGEKYPVVMMFDGEPYTNKKLVNTPLVLNNLIYANKIPPVIGIFVFHKDRDGELLTNPTFGNFIAKTVLPEIRAAYNITSDPHQVVLGGSSFSGLMAMYMGLNYPDLFGKILCQSGSFWAGDNLETLNDPLKANYLYLINEFVGQETKDIEIYMEIGKYEGQEALFGAPSHYFANFHMRDILKLKGYKYKFTTYNGGHEYAYWRESIADGLMYLIGNN